MKSVSPGHDSEPARPYCRRRPSRQEVPVSTTTTPAHAARAELQSFAGELIGPDDTEYDTSRALFNAMIDKRPALIARCKNVNDIASVIRFARDHDLPLAIRAGGHNGGGLASVDDGVVCDLSLFRDVSVDPNARTVRVGGGCLWGEVDAATQPHGLAVPCRDHLDHRRRRSDPRRWARLSDPGPRADDRQSAVGGARARRRDAGRLRAPTSTPTCSGRSAAAAATSAS